MGENEKNKGEENEKLQVACFGVIFFAANLSFKPFTDVFLDEFANAKMIQLIFFKIFYAGI